MKKQYESPYAEKVEFDYKDSVAACFSPFGGGGQKSQQSNVVTEQKPCDPGTSWWVDTNAEKKANNVNNPYWGC